ncbi:Uncharacterised protein [Clostridium putrefaciens]|uniref:Uncharacterized protein n=1 Tax=Clostridium putrefaciens TaxID=99675 RepID=A0A381J919_9CLOT|nr:hypothetical protein [Clostridium putrefaciens]SUY47499.1 Uncharacterised protein [Clostridium putrefaciens]
MEFRLNKIDSELRNEINSKTKEGKVHSKEDISINKDLEQGKEGTGQQLQKEEVDSFKHIKKDNKIFVSAVKVQDIEVKATKDHKSTTKEIYKGSLLDIRK